MPPKATHGTGAGPRVPPATPLPCPPPSAPPPSALSPPHTARDRLPAFRPQLPPADRLLPYLQRIDATRVYSNRGPLVWDLEIRLAEAMGLPAHAVHTAASGTLALALAILAHAGRGNPAGPRPLALVPSLTFVATAQAAELCGYRPVFVDVDPACWTVDPAALAAHPALAQAGLVLAAAPYGVLPDLAGLERLQAATGVPVVVDAAAGFEALCDAPGSASATVPMVLSFHATKSFSTGEGGAVIWDCEDARLRLVRIANFGFLGTREARGPGLNAKMSEYHAAVGLAMLDDLGPRRQAQARVAARYGQAAAAAGLRGRLHLPPGISPAYALYEAADVAACDRAAAALEAACIDSRRWYGRGVDREPWYAAQPPANVPSEPRSEPPADPLPVTRDLCDRLLGLPTAPDLDAAAIARIAAALATAESPCP